MNLYTLLTTIRDAISTNTAIAEWSTLYYNRVHTVFVGADLNDLPGEEQMPLVYLFPSSKGAGYGLTDQPHGIVASCELHNDEYKLVDGLDNCYEFTGIGHIIAFRKLVETALIAVVPAALEATELNTMYSPIEEFPFFQSMDVYNLTQRLYQGDDPFE